MSLLRVVTFLSVLSQVSKATIIENAAIGKKSLPSTETFPSGIQGMMIDQSSPDWATKSLRWSSFSAPTFDYVFSPSNEDDLSAGLAYFTSQGLPFLVKSGGHGFSGTLGSIQDAIMINMENFNYTKMNGDLSVTVGGGVTFDYMISSVDAANRELTTGICPCVGIGGILGGAIGRFQGKYGITNDGMISARVALYNGTIVTASETENSELFWGIRGAGHNFGVLIEANLQTFPSSGPQYNADMMFTGDALEDVLETVNALWPPEDVNLAMVMLWVADLTTLELGIMINMDYAGPEEIGRQYADQFAPFRSSIQESIVTWGELPWAGGMGGLAASCFPSGLPHNQYTMGIKDFDIPTFRTVFDNLADLITAHPMANLSIGLFELYGQTAIDSLPTDYSAFPHRGSFNTMAVTQAAWADDTAEEPARTWARESRDMISQVSGYEPNHVYVNYAQGDEPLSVIYGAEDWRHERLSALKRTYDPNGQFNGFLAIPHNVEDWS